MIIKILHGIRFVFNHLLLILSAIFPRDRKMILFGAWIGNKYDDNPRFVFEYTVKNRPDIKAYWLSPNQDIVDEVIERGFPAINSHSLKAYYLALRTGYEYCCLGYGDIGNNLVYCLGGCVLINSWHGIPLKKIMNDDKVTRGDIGKLMKISNKIRDFVTPKTYVICTSEIFHPIFQSAFQKEQSKVLNLGQARNDFFFQEHVNPYREKYKGKTIIVYMPTHRQEGRKEMNMYDILDLPSLNELCKHHNAILLIKKHFYHRSEKSIGTEFEFIREITNENPETPVLLYAADILISDYSGCYPDHLLLKRPQVFYCFDLDDYLTNDRDMYFNYLDVTPGPVCKTNDELVMELSRILSNNDKYKDQREKMLDFFYSKENQGIVSPKQLDTILNL